MKKINHVVKPSPKMFAPSHLPAHFLVSFGADGQAAIKSKSFFAF